jgi:hypothetical protein
VGSQARTTLLHINDGAAQPRCILLHTRRASGPVRGAQGPVRRLDMRPGDDHDSNVRGQTYIVRPARTHSHLVNRYGARRRTAARSWSVPSALVEPRPRGAANHCRTPLGRKYDTSIEIAIE